MSGIVNATGAKSGVIGTVTQETGDVTLTGTQTLTNKTTTRVCEATHDADWLSPTSCSRQCYSQPGSFIGWAIYKGDLET